MKHLSGLAGIVALVLLIIGIWIGSYVVITRNFDQGTWGIVGDLFGAVNALFSGLALAGVVYAILLQRRDIKLQQEQLDLSNQEFRQQNELVQEQLRILRESFDFDKVQARNNNDPCFEWQPGTGTMEAQTYAFRNKGGRFKIIAIGGHPGISIVLEPPMHTMINHDDTGRLVIQNRQPGQMLPVFPLWFQLRCTTFMGEMWIRDFQIPSASDKPQQQG